jgi:hypothetical protein
MTTSAEAQRFEDELAKAKTVRDLRGLDEKLAVLTVPHEEWEVLYRQRLQVELQLLGRSSKVLEPNREDEKTPPGPKLRRASALDFGVAAVGLGLIVVDVILLLTSRQPRRTR